MYPGVHQGVTAVGLASKAVLPANMAWELEHMCCVAWKDETSTLVEKLSFQSSSASPAPQLRMQNAAAEVPLKLER